MKRDTYLLNPRLSLCTRMKIKVMNESSSLLKCVLFVLPLICPHILSGIIFRRSKNSSMRTFASEYAMEPLMGVHPIHVERVPPLFILDLPTQTCFSIIKNNIFKIGNSFEISYGQQDMPKSKIPLDLHACSVPSIFMHCPGCNGPLKKACLASEVSESCLKN